MKKIFLLLLIIYSYTFAFDNVDSIIEINSDNTKIQKMVKILSKTKNNIIQDIDYMDSYFCAVGEDNSPETRDLYSRDEYHLGIALCSYDNGKSWHKIEIGGSLDFVTFLNKNNIVAIGSMEGTGGYIYLSQDSGKSWKQVYEGGFFLNKFKYKHKVFAIGYNILSSQDGKHWQYNLKGNDGNEYHRIIKRGNTLKAVGSTYDAKSIDGGRTWKRIKK